MSRWLSLLTAKRAGRSLTPALVEESPLCGLDPRAKLALSLSASLMVMLPIGRLSIFLVLYGLLIAWAKLLPTMARQVWRMRWILLFLFALDWWLIDLNLAILVSLRLALLAGTFSLLFATTTFGAFRLALERLGIPYWIAFSMGLAFQSLGLLEEEWRAIREAQQARGISLSPKGLREIIRQASTWVALTIPAVVLTTRRAWAVTETASARGFDSPRRLPYHQIVLRWVDWLVIVISLVMPVIFYWR